jgi:hypothetical protein
LRTEGGPKSREWCGSFPGKAQLFDVNDGDTCGFFNSLGGATLSVVGLQGENLVAVLKMAARRVLTLLGACCGTLIILGHKIWF